MNLLIVTPVPPDPRGFGGIPLAVHAQIAGLIGRHDITLVTVAGPEKNELDSLDSLSHTGIDIRAARRSMPRIIKRWQQGWRFARTWTIGKYPWRTTWLWDAGIQKHLDRIFAEKSIDLISVNDNAMGIYRYPEHIPKILTEHKVRHRESTGLHESKTINRFQKIFYELNWRRWREYQERVWSKFDRVQVFTERDAKIACEVAPAIKEKLRVIPFGIDPPPATNPMGEQPGTLLFLGNYTHRANEDAAIWLVNEVMPKLRAMLPGVRLFLVGAHPAKAIRRLACEDITVTGAVPDVHPYLEKAAVLLAPVLSGGGMGMKVLMAMAVGKPVITTARGAEGFMRNGKRPPVIIRESSEEVAEACAFLLASPKVRKDLGNRARETVLKYHNAETYGSALEALYAESTGRISHESTANLARLFHANLDFK